VNSFNVQKVDNGFVVEFFEETQVPDGEGKTYTQFKDSKFVFESAAKLKKGLKLIVGKLTKEGE
jgi:hypothetical protein